MSAMKTYNRRGSDQLVLGRNSHVPACVECRIRKAKCSKTQPCGPCVRHGRNCRYASKAKRTPLTREHLTAVENRLHVLEATLDKLFPDGDIRALALDVLDEGTNSQLTPDNLGSSPSARLTHSGTHVPPGYGVVGDRQSPDQPPGHVTIEIDPFCASLPVTDLEQTNLIDNYFAEYHTLYPLLHEDTFRRSLCNQLPLPTFQLLVRIVLAIGAWLTPQARQGVDRELFVEAQQLLQAIPIRDQADITTVQALLLLADFAQKQGDADESGHYTGAALRVAVTLSLHTEPPNSFCELDKEIRRRVWWSVYCAESCSAKIYGRPLLLPEDDLITVHLVSNIHENALSSSTRMLPAPTDDMTIYTGLIQQSSYHRMANRIYRRLLSNPAVTPKDVDEAEQTIDAWHQSSSFCVRVGSRANRPEWQFTARRRQILCDKSFRLLIRRPILMRWFKNPESSSTLSGTAYLDSAGEAHCRAEGLKIARATIGLITQLLTNGHYSRLTLAFTLYSFFHALIVPLIHVKTDPWSPASISCMQDLEKAKSVFDHLSIESDAVSRHFTVVLQRLFEVASQVNEESLGNEVVEDGRESSSQALQGANNDIFGRKEVALLEEGGLSLPCGLDFSEWVHL